MSMPIQESSFSRYLSSEMAPLKSDSPITQLIFDNLKTIEETGGDYCRYEMNGEGRITLLKDDPDLLLNTAVQRDNLLSFSSFISELVTKKLLDKSLLPELSQAIQKTEQGVKTKIVSTNDDTGPAQVQGVPTKKI